MKRLIRSSFLSLALVAGCARVEPGGDYQRAAELIRTSAGVSAVFNPEASSDVDVEARLADGLTVNEAVELALLNNRELQVAFYDIGIARADWVQSGLLSNPSLGAAVQFPDGGGDPKVTAGIAQNILELWRLPARRAVAQQELDRTILNIARKATELVQETKQTYFRAVAAEQQVKLAAESSELIDKTGGVVRTQREAGLASDFDQNLAQGQSLLAGLGLRTAELEMRSARRKLAGLLSLDRVLDDVALVDSLDAGEAPTAPIDALIVSARENRADLTALRTAIESAGMKVRYERSAAWSSLEMGAEAELSERRSGESGGDWVVGPTFALELPIFDQNQAQAAKAGYELEQAKRRYLSLYLAVAMQIRSSLDDAATARETVVFYREQLQPQAERNLTFARDAYAAGQGNILAIVEAQRTLLDARRNLLAAQLRSAEAQAELEAAVGVRLSESDRTVK